MSMQAVTRVNAEQASKSMMRKPTRQQFGEGRCPRAKRATRSPRVPPGYWRRHAGKRKTDATREAPWCGPARGQPAAREGQAGRLGVAERPVVPMSPGNAGGGKGPQFKTNVRRGKGPEIGQPANSTECSETTDGITCQSEG